METYLSSVFEKEHEVVRADRNGADVKVDITSPESIEKMYKEVGAFDAVISTAGPTFVGRWNKLTDKVFRPGVEGKMMGQINLVLVGQNYINAKGSFSLITGELAHHPQRNFANASAANGAVEGFVRAAAIELHYYVLNYTGKRRLYNFVFGNEVRQTYGFRVFSKNDRFNYELEGTYQSGKFNDLQIKAYSVSADINYAAIAKTLTIGIAGNYASGDRSNNDNELNTYNFLFSKPQYGLTAPIGATNIVNINPYISFKPFKAGRIDAGAFFMWRQSTQDGTYSPLAKVVRPGNSILFSSTSKRIGTLLILESAVAVTKNFSLGVDAGYFIAGDYPKETGKGKDISYSAVKATIKF